MSGFWDAESNCSNWMTDDYKHRKFPLSDTPILFTPEIGYEFDSLCCFLKFSITVYDL